MRTADLDAVVEIARNGQEAIDALKLANPEVAVDPASFYFFKAVAHHATAMKTGDKEQAVAEAKGQSARFLKVYDEYKKAPDVTRERIYLETMERVFGGTDKIIIDQNGKIVFQHAGEGRYEEIDRTVARLLNANS